MKRERMGEMINKKKNKPLWTFLLIGLALGLLQLAQGAETKATEEGSKAAK